MRRTRPVAIGGEPVEIQAKKANATKRKRTLKGFEEIGKYIGMSRATFSRHKEKIPHYREGRTIYSRTDWLDKWQEEQRHEL